MIAEHEGLMKEMQPVLSRISGAQRPERLRISGAQRPERLAAPDALAVRHLESVAPVDFYQALRDAANRRSPRCLNRVSNGSR
jgi:hypothetical protein